MYNRVGVAVAICDHQKCKLHVGAEGFWVAELQVQQDKIVRKSCFGNFN